MPAVPGLAGLVETPEGPRWFAPISEEPGLWIEGDPAPTEELRHTSSAAMIDHLLRVEREVGRLSQELASRYEEIDLLYTISEILGQTVRLEQASRTIIRAVSSVVGARRASIMVHDDEQGILRTVASQGIPPGRSGEVSVDDPISIAARVFRTQRPLIGDPTEGVISSAGTEERGYQGVAFMSVPITYAAPGGPVRCIGVVNLTDRVGGDRFGLTDRKLVAAVANQIGAALENARLAEREREQERLERELELASTLQQGLLPLPDVLSGDAEVGVQCVPLESVGGDFYGFNRLGGGAVGVMVGDVSSHGFSAALLMASALGTAGLHAAAAAGAPDVVLSALRATLAGQLASTESFITMVYARIDPAAGRLVFANAGHPHVFRIAGSGESWRLEATAPPLGLGEDAIGYQTSPWVPGEDLLCIFTDGVSDATNAAGERFGERRVLDAVIAQRGQPPSVIVDTVMALVESFGTEPADDRTLLVLKV